MSTGIGFRWWWASCAAGGFCPSAFIGVCCFCRCLSTAGQWTLMCGSGVHWWMWGCLFALVGSPCVPVGFWGGPGGCRVNVEHLIALICIFSISYL